MANYLDEAIASLRRFEGSVPWMYLDTAGRVTVGIGLMLPSLEAARILPFAFGDRKATIEEIAQEFARVSAMKPGLLAKLYRRAQSLTLSDDAINGRLHQTLLGFEGYLRAHLAGYDGLPDAAKLGLLDMVYNLGPGKLFAEYPELLKAVLEGNWKAAAAASFRRGPATARNAWTRQQFLDAAATLTKIQGMAAEAHWGTMVWGALTGITAAIATGLLLGEADRMARSRRRRLAATQ